MFKIEKGIPVADPSTKPRKGVSKYPLAELMVGESFLVPVKAQERSKRRAAINTRVYQFTRDNQKKKFVVRLVDDGVRVWRTK